MLSSSFFGGNSGLETLCIADERDCGMWGFGTDATLPSAEESSFDEKRDFCVNLARRKTDNLDIDRAGEWKRSDCKVIGVGGMKVGSGSSVLKSDVGNSTQEVPTQRCP